MGLRKGSEIKIEMTWVLSLHSSALVTELSPWPLSGGMTADQLS